MSNDFYDDMVVKWSKKNRFLIDAKKENPHLKINLEDDEQLWGDRPVTEVIPQEVQDSWSNRKEEGNSPIELAWNLLADFTNQAAAKQAHEVMINGLTEEETEKTASCLGLTTFNPNAELNGPIFTWTEPKQEGMAPEDNDIFYLGDEPCTPVEKPNTVSDVISPKHYKDIVPGYEYMDVMEHILGFEGTVEHLRGQIFKYMMRFGKKDNRRVEAGKIAWYAMRLEDVIQRNEEGTFPIRPQTND